MLLESLKQSQLALRDFGYNLSYIVIDQATSQVIPVNSLFTALIPQTTVVLPIFAIAEPSDVEIDPAFTIIGRNLVSSLPSGLIPWAK